jgi:hypothetical protein
VSVCTCVCVCACACVRACVCEREREGGREREKDADLTWERRDKKITDLCWRDDGRDNRSSSCSSGSRVGESRRWYCW